MPCASPVLSMPGRDELLRRFDIRAPPRPAYVVWELTLACDQPCTHCGSRAGKARPGELSADEALEVVHQLAAMKTSEVVLIGGEAYLHPGFLEIIRALAAAGINPTLTTGGRGLTAPLAMQMAQAGLTRVSVSIDGLQLTHDLLRASPGSFESATAALASLKQVGVATAANTNLNRLNVGELEALYEHLRAQGITSWQVQLTAALGRAADRPAMLLQPWELIELLPRVTALKVRAWREGVLLMPGNNLGYFGPEEAVLRSQTPAGEDHWQGCQAGRLGMGIEADGAVKGCPSLQTAHYVGGNLKENGLEELWASPVVGFARRRTVEDLWGFCRTCPFGATCLGGCTFTAHALFGRPGNNPYCHFRTRTLAARGLRERLVAREHAPGLPFDNGRFELIEEPLDAADPAPRSPREMLRRADSRQARGAAAPASPDEGSLSTDTQKHR